MSIANYMQTMCSLCGEAMLLAEAEPLERLGKLPRLPIMVHPRCKKAALRVRDLDADDKLDNSIISSK